ncbi:hypothetical protein LRR80_01630 [Streptomyces sp. RO-S4]|uniref:hypothetical protein n=1 Tax=unclassified Streptomyces TaxID=2593676 RepID=UPI00208F966B|nr:MULTISPECIES: hypothetical protein [unclassified Streptomyces]MCO4695579.1 hypothetical protein [Streptomyces sp. RO-S4]MDU0302911.1 hypothetical protein [Streptomyces sp. PAL114]
MEQRIGSSSQPLEGAGFDPAFIPGLTSPATGREEDVDEAAEAAPKAEVAEEAVESAESAESVAAPASEDTGGEPEPVPDGPVFEASDRRAAIVADHRGVRLKLDDQECEFRWDEIGAVETETARFGKRYTVTVHTPERRWYPLEIDADSRSRFAEWDTALDAVLDRYFDDGAEEPTGSGERDESDEQAESEATATEGPETADRA